VRWLEQGISVARILAAVDEVAEKRRKKRTKSRLTLTSCKRSIEGKGASSPPAITAPATDEVTLTDYATELATMEIHPSLQGEREKLVARIGSLRGSAEYVATEAVAACRAFQEAAWTAASSQRTAIRTQAERELSALKNTLKPEILEAYIEEVARDIVSRQTPLVSAKAVWDRVSTV